MLGNSLPRASLDPTPRRHKAHALVHREEAPQEVLGLDGGIHRLPLNSPVIPQSSNFGKAHGVVAPP